MSLHVPAVEVARLSQAHVAGMLVEEEQGSGVRKVHAFVQESTALVWDANGTE